MPTTPTAESAPAEPKFAEFWAERDAHAKKVADALSAVQTVVNEGVDAGLYRDGITPVLSDVQNMIQHLGNRLTNAPPVGDPEFLAANQTAPRT